MVDTRIITPRAERALTGLYPVPDIVFTTAGETHDMSVYIGDQVGYEVTATQILGLNTSIATYDHATRLLTAVAAGTMTGLQYEVTVTERRGSGSAEGVSGSIAEGQVITISAIDAEDFGATGPDVVIFEDSEGGTPEVASTLTNPKVGEWTSHEWTESLWKSGGRSHGVCIDANGTQRMRNYYHPAGFTEVFVCYASGIPNQYFPGASTPYTFPGVSSFKGVWIYDDYAGSGFQSDGDSDICLPTHSGGGWIHYAGNDAQSSPFDVDENYWSFDNWTRFSGWLKADETNPTTTAGVWYAQCVSPDKGFWSAYDDTTRAVFSPGDTEQWEVLGAPGWRGNGDQTNCQLRIDDVYCAVGAGAAARVEIGDNATYTSCTDLAICTPTSWSSSSITATVRAGLWWNSSLSGKYLFVIDKDNTVISSRLIS